MAVEVTSGGRTWKVGRRWLPRRRIRWPWTHRRRAKKRSRGGRGDWFDLFDVFEIDSIAWALLAIAVVLFMIFIGWPVLVALFDVLVAVLLLVAGVAGRVLLRRPWVVEAVAEDGSLLVWKVVGWNRSAELIRAVVGALQRGDPPPPGHFQLDRPV